MENIMKKNMKTIIAAMAFIAIGCGAEGARGRRRHVVSPVAPVSTNVEAVQIPTLPEPVITPVVTVTQKPKVSAAKRFVAFLQRHPKMTFMLGTALTGATIYAGVGAVQAYKAEDGERWGKFWSPTNTKRAYNYAFQGRTINEVEAVTLNGVSTSGRTFKKGQRYGLDL
jgi:hypothetical protein